MFKSITSSALILISFLCWGEETWILLPTSLEEFAHRADVKIVFAQEAARFSNEQTYVTITAIVLESGERPTKKMQGIRFDLVNENARDQVYLDAQGISEVLRDVRLLRHAVKRERLENEEVYGMNIRGTGSPWCLHPRPLVHTLCPEYYRKSDSSGILIRPVKGTPKVPRFLLPGTSPKELEDAINTGVRILENMN